MTRVGHTLKDKGHYGRKAAGYTVLALLFLPVVLCEGGRWLGENVLYPLTSKLHRWMRPCLYAPRPKGPAPELAPEWRARLDGEGD